MDPANIETRTFLLPSSVSYTEVVHRTDFNDQIVFLTLNRPNRCNALSLELLDSFISYLDEIAQNKQIRVIVINGNGRNFCSGLDLKEASLDESVLVSREEASAFQNESSRKTFFQFITRGFESDSAEMFPVPQGYWNPHRVLELMLRLKKQPQIVVGAVQGTACGGGAGIVSACDFVVASDDFRFSFPELNRGLLPSLLFPFLKRKLSPVNLRRLVLTGQPVDATTAKGLDFVQAVVSPGELVSRAIDFSQQFCFGSAEISALTKQMINASEIPSLDELRQGLVDHWKCWSEPEAKERIAAFLEKREPVFENHS